VDAIIFGALSHSLVSSFEAMMENKFQMSMMRELTFFLGIQVKKTKEDTFVHQAKYTKDLIKKIAMTDAKLVPTPMSTMTTLHPDEDGEAVDQREYMSMIDSLLYLTVTRPDIQFIVCLCVRFQASPRCSHQTPIQRIFRYLNTHSNLGFGIPLLHHLILLAFRMLILLDVVLTERALLVPIIFSDSLLFASHLENNLQLLNPLQRLGM
jgi:hypothetical protein